MTGLTALDVRTARAARSKPRQAKSTSLVNRNISVAWGRSSLRLEPELWEALDGICARERVKLTDLIQQIEKGEGHTGGRTSAVRVFVFRYYRKAADDAPLQGLASVVAHDPRPGVRP